MPTPSTPDTVRSPETTMPADVVDRLVTFAYRGWLFSCGTRRVDGETYLPIVFCRPKAPDDKEIRLPPDTDNVAYATEAEALRHAEQQAVRWVHDRTGDRPAQF